jgi:hypothetical protein
MKKTIQAFILIASLLLIFACNNSGKGSKSKATCTENEAYDFAKNRLETTLKMDISASNTISSSSESCTYEFLFEGISRSYASGVDVTITVQKTSSGWDAIKCDVKTV